MHRTHRKRILNCILSWNLRFFSVSFLFSIPPTINYHISRQGEHHRVKSDSWWVCMHVMLHTYVTYCWLVFDCTGTGRCWRSWCAPSCDPQQVQSTSKMPWNSCRSRQIWCGIAYPCLRWTDNPVDQGEAPPFHKVDGYQGGQCTFLTLLTDFSGDTVRRMSKAGRKYAVVQVPVPSAARDHNSHMRRVDLSNQLIGSYSSWSKSRKWYLTELHHLDAVTDSFLLHKELCGKLEQQPMPQQTFLSGELCAAPSQKGREAQGSQQHVPVAALEGASGSIKASSGRRRCKLCGNCTLHAWAK